MTNQRKPNETNVQEVRKQIQQSMQKQSQFGQQNQMMGEEFAAETDVEEVKKQNQQSQAKKSKTSTQQPNPYGRGTR